jgi:hypothetical protein
MGLPPIFRETMCVCVVRFQVLKAASMKMEVFWVVVPCSMVNIDPCCRGACCLSHQGCHRSVDRGTKHL